MTNRAVGGSPRRALRGGGAALCCRRPAASPAGRSPSPSPPPAAGSSHVDHSTPPSGATHRLRRRQCRVGRRARVCPEAGGSAQSPPAAGLAAAARSARHWTRMAARPRRRAAHGGVCSAAHGAPLVGPLAGRRRAGSRVHARQPVDAGGPGAAKDNDAPPKRHRAVAAARAGRGARPAAAGDQRAPRVLGAAGGAGAGVGVGGRERNRTGQRCGRRWRCRGACSLGWQARGGVAGAARRSTRASAALLATINSQQVVGPQKSTAVSGGRQRGTPGECHRHITAWGRPAAPYPPACRQTPGSVLGGWGRACVLGPRGGGAAGASGVA